MWFYHNILQGLTSEYFYHIFINYFKLVMGVGLVGVFDDLFAKLTDARL